MSSHQKSRQHSFDVNTAKKYGVDEAIMINHFIFWIEKNLANGKHKYKGKTWTYNKQEAFTVLFPYWTYEQIRRILKSLITKGVLVTDNFNRAKYDRTLWYAFKDESAWINHPEDPPTLENIDMGISTNGDGRIHESNQENPQIEMGESTILYQIPTTDTFTNNNYNYARELLSCFSHDSEKAKANTLLNSLSDEQRDIAVSAFLKASKKGFDVSAMACLTALVKIGLRGGLIKEKSIQSVAPSSTTPPAKKVPTSEEKALLEKQRANERLHMLKNDILKAYDKNKNELIRSFQQFRGIFVNRNMFMEKDLREMGLLYLFQEA